VSLIPRGCVRGLSEEGKPLHNRPRTLVFNHDKLKHFQAGCFVVAEFLLTIAELLVIASAQLDFVCVWLVTSLQI